MQELEEQNVIFIQEILVENQKKIVGTVFNRQVRSNYKEHLIS